MNNKILIVCNSGRNIDYKSIIHFSNLKIITDAQDYNSDEFVPNALIIDS